jgi:hypothetical protein
MKANLSFNLEDEWDKLSFSQVVLAQSMAISLYRMAEYLKQQADSGKKAVLPKGEFYNILEDLGIHNVWELTR